MKIAAIIKPIKLSILIPAYNVERYISECLGSIEHQLTDECEVIVYDDASTDGTVQIVKTNSIFQRENFRFEQGAINNGLSFARNTLKDISTGEYVWFLDSDDKILDGAVKDILQCINSSSPDTIFFNYNIWLENPTARQIRKGLERASYTGPINEHSADAAQFFIATMKSCNLHAWSKVFHKDLFVKGSEFPVGRIFEDISVIPFLASLSNKAYYLNKPLVAYRQRPSSIVSGLKPNMQIESLMSLIDLRMRYENQYGAMCEETLQAYTYFASRQLRGIIKAIIRTAPRDVKALFLKKALQTFQDTHKRNYFYVLKTCYKEGGLGLCYQVTRRVLHAKLLTARN